MGIEANKALVRRYLDAVKGGDPSLPELLADDVRWWVPPSSRMGGSHQGREAVLSLMQSGVALYDPATPMRLEVQRMVAEGDDVCVELVIEARTAKGEDYRNHYHFVFRVDGGRIAEIREHLDTLYAERRLFG